jgi:hypothetical protein
MRRHTIIGHFGPGDHVQVPIATTEVMTRLDLVASQRRLDHGIGSALDDLQRLGVFPSEIGIDLMVLATLVHAADTRISRATESQDTWTREIRLVVPVSNLSIWTSASALLQRMLNFLTGDRWTIGFRARLRAFATAVPRRPRHLNRLPFDGVSLFSGGLDSLIGAIDVLENGGTPLLVSHAGDGATSDAQNTCFEALKAHYKRQSFDRLRVWMNFPGCLVQGSDSEKTTRGRSFLFFAIGIFAGTGLDSAFTLRVPENGLIALNVPLDPLRLGALSTHTTHPFYMARWNELLATLGIACRIENPHWDKTKGEMVDACANKVVLASLIPSSLSCASPTKGRWQGHGIEHCGYCLPCLIRRAALEKGLGRGIDPTVYTLSDLAAHPLDTRQSEGQQVRSFQFSMERLRARPDLAKLLIHKPGPLFDEPARLNDLASVYQRGMNEVAALLAAVQTRPN